MSTLTVFSPRLASSFPKELMEFRREHLLSSTSLKGAIERHLDLYGYAQLKQTDFDFPAIEGGQAIPLSKREIEKYDESLVSLGRLIGNIVTGFPKSNKNGVTNIVNETRHMHDDNPAPESLYPDVKYNQGFGGRVGLHSELILDEQGLIQPDYLIFRGIRPANIGGKSLYWDRKPAFEEKLHDLIDKYGYEQAVMLLSKLFDSKGLTVSFGKYSQDISALDLNRLDEVIIPQSTISSANGCNNHKKTIQASANQGTQEVLNEISFQRSKQPTTVQEIDLQGGDYLVVLNSRIEHGRQEYWGPRFIQRLLVDSPFGPRGFTIAENLSQTLQAAKAAQENSIVQGIHLVKNLISN